MSSDIDVRTISWLEGMLDTTVTAYEDHRNALQCVRDEIVQQCGAEGGKCFHLNSQRTAEILQGIDDVLSQSELQLCGMEDWENINGGGAAVAAARRQRLEDAPPLSQEVDLRQRRQQQQQQRQREQTSVNTRSGTNREQGPSAATGAQEPAMQRSNNSVAKNVEGSRKRTMANGDATAPDGSPKSPSMEPRGTHSANGMKNDEQEGERQQRQRQRQQQPAARDQEDRQSARPHTESLNSSRPFPTTPALQQIATPPPPPPPQGQQFDPRATSTTGGASSSSRYQPVHTTQSDPQSTPPPPSLHHEGPGDTVKVKEPGNNAAVGSSSSSSSSSSDIRNNRNDRSRVECVRGGDYEQYPPNEGDTPYEPVPSEASSLPRRRITRSNNNSNSAEAATSCGNRPGSQRRSRVCGKADVDNDEDGGDSSVHTTDKRLPRSSRSSRYSGSNHGGGEMPKDSLQRKPVAVQKQQQNDRDGIREDQAAGSKTTTPPSSSVPRSTLKSITKRESVPLQPWPLPENKDPRLTGSRVSESRISNNKSKDAAANPITTNSTNTSYNTMNETPQRPPAQNATPPPTSQARPHNNIRNSDGINRGDINNNNKSGSSRTRSSERASAAPVRKAYSPSPYHPYNAAVATAASALASVPRQHSADKSVDVKSPPSPAAAAGAHPSGSRASSTSVPSTPPPPPSVLQQQHQNCERGDGMVVTPSVSMLPQHRQTSAEALADGASAEGGSENHSTPVQEAQLAIPKGPGAVRPLRTAIPKRTTTSINDSKQIEIAMYGAPLLRQPGAPPKGGVLEDAPEVDEFLKMEQDRLEEKREREEEECRRNIEEAERVAARRKGRSASILAMDSPGTLVMIKDRETGGVIMAKAERPKPTAAELQLRQERDILHTQLERMQLEYANVIARRRDTGGEPRYAQLHHRITRVQKDLQRLNVETAQVMKLEKESGQYREPAPKRLM